MEERTVANQAEIPLRHHARIDDHAYLLGAPPVGDFLGFLKTRVQAGSAELSRLHAAWRAAASHWRELESTEGGFADRVEIRPLPEHLKSLAERELEDPSVRRALGDVSHYWAYVNIDQLVVHQRNLDLSYVRQLGDVFPAYPTDKDLFELATGKFKRDPAQITVTQSENVTTFASLSSDLRVLETTLLDPRCIQGYHPPGRAAYIVAVAVGYGINCASVLRIQGRLILQNGTHRASMLFENGIRQFPCLVREISTEEDLDMIGASDIRQNLSFYLHSRRPPRLRDFFDPLLRAKVKVPWACRLTHVQANTQQSRVSIP